MPGTYRELLAFATMLRDEDDEDDEDEEDEDDEDEEDEDEDEIGTYQRTPL